MKRLTLNAGLDVMRTLRECPCGEEGTEVLILLLLMPNGGWSVEEAAALGESSTSAAGLPAACELFAGMQGFSM
jgi:hypothetical protein